MESLQTRSSLYQRDRSQTGFELRGYRISAPGTTQGQNPPDPAKNRKGNEMRNMMAFMAVVLLLVSCSALSTPIPSPASARTPTPSMTTEPSLSVTPAPSVTLEPTLSPVPSPSAGASSAPSQTPIESGALDCALLMQTVRNGTHFKPGDQFSISWKVRNTGTAGWDSGTLDFTYIAGTKMYQYPLVHLQGNVDPGNISYLMADMRAPHNPGKYSTTWSLRQGDNYFCHVGLAIFVDR